MYRLGGETSREGGDLVKRQFGVGVGVVGWLGQTFLCVISYIYTYFFFLLHGETPPLGFCCFFIFQSSCSSNE